MAEQNLTPEQIALNDAFLATPTANIYANGFMVAIGAGDVFVSLQRNGVPQASLNLSYTSAKTLAKNLAHAISEVERINKTTIITIEEVTQNLQSSQQV